MKTKTAIYSKHFLSLCALFTLAGGVVSAPFEAAKGYSFYALLISAVLGVFLCFLIDEYYNEQLFFRVLAVGIAAFCIVDTAADFCTFISDSLLADTPIIFIAIVFVAVAVYAVTKGYSALLKFALITAFFTAILLIFFFFATADKFKISNVFPIRKFEINGVFGVTLVYFRKIILPILLLPVFKKNYLGKNANKSTFWGVLLGFSALFLTVLNSLLIFGNFFAERVLYPYAAAISTVTFGRLFTRLDGFAYIIYFSAAIIRTVTCFLVIKKAFRKEGF